MADKLTKAQAELVQMLERHPDGLSLSSVRQNVSNALRRRGIVIYTPGLTRGVRVRLAPQRGGGDQ